MPAPEAIRNICRAAAATGTAANNTARYLGAAVGISVASVTAGTPASAESINASLQAAFVDYGGNRHSFLAFSEIHPDYYQIPAADRRALIEEDRVAAEEAEAALRAEQIRGVEVVAGALRGERWVPRL